MRVQSGYVWLKTENIACFFEHRNVHADDMVCFYSPHHCLLIDQEHGTVFGMIYIY
jgi:hypothetical protein